MRQDQHLRFWSYYSAFVLPPVSRNIQLFNYTLGQPLPHDLRASGVSDAAAFAGVTAALTNTRVTNRFPGFAARRLRLRISVPLVADVMCFLSLSTVRFASHINRGAFAPTVEYPLAHLLGRGVELPEGDPLDEDFSCDVKFGDTDVLEEFLLSPYNDLISLMEFSGSELLAPVLSELKTRDAISRLSPDSCNKSLAFAWIVVDGLWDTRRGYY